MHPFPLSSDAKVNPVWAVPVIVSTENPLLIVGWLERIDVGETNTKFIKFAVRFVARTEKYFGSTQRYL